MKWDRSSSCWLGLKNPDKWRKQSPSEYLQLHGASLYFSTAWPLERFLVFSGVFPCCHYTHSNENCSCVSCVMLVAAQSWGASFSKCEDGGRRMNKQQMQYEWCCRETTLDASSYRGGCGRNSWVLFMAFQLIPKKKKKNLLRRHSKKIMLLGSLHRELLGYPCPCNSTA